MARNARTIPIAAASEDACASAEPFVLMVIGSSMAPEFEEGDVIVVEPGGLARDGSYVVAFAGGDWTLRRVQACGPAWRLVALDARWPATDVPDLACVRGVVIQRSTPGRRERTKLYA